MIRLARTGGIPSWFVTLLLLAAAPAWAAEPAPAPKPAGQQADQELGEVLVEGRRSTEQPPRPTFEEYQQDFNWLARLVGRFVVDGQVDLHGLGRSKDVRMVSGRADCIGYGVGPGVQCELKLRWPDSTGPNGETIPGGVSSLNPAVMLFGFVPGKAHIHHTLVDSNSFAEVAAGPLVTPDTMESRGTCATITRNCERVVRITAKPDLAEVVMRITFVIEQVESLRFTFVMHRVPGSPSTVYGRKPR